MKFLKNAAMLAVAAICSALSMYAASEFGMIAGMAEEPEPIPEPEPTTEICVDPLFHGYTLEDIQLNAGDVLKLTLNGYDADSCYLMLFDRDGKELAYEYMGIGAYTTYEYTAETDLDYIEIGIQINSAGDAELYDYTILPKEICTGYHSYTLENLNMHKGDVLHLTFSGRGSTSNPRPYCDIMLSDAAYNQLASEQMNFKGKMVYEYTAETDLDTVNVDIQLYSNLKAELTDYVVYRADSDVYADVNGDGVLSVFDVIQLQKWLCKAENVVCAQNADLNGDGCIDIFDLGLLKRALLQQYAASEPVMMYVQENHAWNSQQTVSVTDTNGNTSGQYIFHDDYDKTGFLNLEAEDWYTEVTSIMQSNRREPTYTAEEMEEILAFMETVENYKDCEMKYYPEQGGNDMGYNKLYGIYKDENGTPQYVLLCQTGDMVGCLDNDNVRDFIRMLQENGHFIGIDLDTELDFDIVDSKWSWNGDLEGERNYQSYIAGSEEELLTILQDVEGVDEIDCLLMDEDFFEEHIAVVIYSTLGAGNRNIIPERVVRYCDDLIVYTTTEFPEFPTPDMTYNRIILSVDRADAPYATQVSLVNTVVIIEGKWW